MRLSMIMLAAAFGLTAAGCETYGGGYGGGYGGAPGGGRLQLSRCTQQALVGAGIGAVLGGVTAAEGARTEGAALGAALGGAGTFGVCKYMDQNSYSRVQNGYYTAASSGQPYNTTWQGPEGNRALAVTPAPQGPNCRALSATLSVPGEGVQQLPRETYCRGPDGQWRPA